MNVLGYNAHLSLNGLSSFSRQSAVTRSRPSRNSLTARDSYFVHPGYITDGEGALPSAALSITYCKDARLGWAITEPRLCGECADFVVRCDKTSCHSQQTSSWRWECWDVRDM